MITTRVAAFLTILLNPLAFAHDPREHMKEGDAEPDCAVMALMDHDKMDMSDPVTQAMMKQCMDALHPETDTSDECSPEEKKEESCMHPGKRHSVEEKGHPPTRTGS